MKLADIYAVIETELNEVETGIRNTLSHSPLAITNLAEDILKTGGKRLRPSLVLLSAKACGYEGKEGLNLAVAIELIHTATLIHDDVIDSAALRRGEASVNSRWGNHISILVGDYLYSKAISLLLIDGNIDIQRIVSSAVNETCEGEIIQSMSNWQAAEKIERVSFVEAEAEYLEIIKQKTAALIAAACHCGAYLGNPPLQLCCYPLPGGDDTPPAPSQEGNNTPPPPSQEGNKRRDSLQSYGQNLGIGFQIIDDILDIVGDEKQLGKLVCNDLREGRITLPVIFFLKNAQMDEKKRFEQTFTSGEFDNDNIKWIIDSLHRYHAFEYAMGVAKKYIETAKEDIKTLPDSDAKKSLLMLGDYVLEREG